MKTKLDLNSLNRLFCQKFYSAVMVDIIDRRGVIAAKSSLSEFRRQSRLRAISVRPGLTEAIAQTHTVAQLRAVLARFLRVRGNPVPKRSIIICDERRRTMHGNRQWRRVLSRRPPPKAPRLWSASAPNKKIAIGQRRWVKSVEDGKIYPAQIITIIRDYAISRDCAIVEYDGERAGIIEGLSFENIGPRITYDFRIGELHRVRALEDDQEYVAMITRIEPDFVGVAYVADNEGVSQALPYQNIGPLVI